MSAPVPERTLQRLPALDAIRVVGALAVAAHHVGFATGVNTGPNLWGAWLARLDVGVAVFFVLSGFLLFRPWAYAKATGADAPSTRTYLWRRALRILPAYWVTVVVCLLLIPRNGDATDADWARHLTLTQVYVSGGLEHGLSQTWSLATEVVFYLLLPVLAAVLLRRRRRPGAPVVIVLLGLAVTMAWVGLVGAGLLSAGLHTMWLPAYGLWFGLGMALASAHVALRTGIGRQRRILDELGAAPLACWVAALAVYAVSTTPVAGPRDLTEPTAAEFGTKMVLYALVGVLLILPVAFGPHTAVKEALSSGTARWLGAISYGLFLWHPFVIEMYYALTDRPEFTGDPLWTYVIVVAGGVVLAAVSYYVVERPFQRLAHRRRRPPSSTESQSSTTAATASS